VRALSELPSVPYLDELRTLGTSSITAHFGALAELRDAGLIRHLGISNVGPEQLAKAWAIAPVVCVQNRYGIGSRPVGGDDMLRACGEAGIAFVPYFAIAGDGREQGTRGPEPEAVLRIARTHWVTSAQVRLAWTLQQGQHLLAIPGTGNPDHLLGNVAAGCLRLSQEELEMLQQATDLGKLPTANGRTTRVRRTWRPIEAGPTAPPRRVRSHRR
jgi:pyridoxine 4-dehydrogenase